MHPLARTITPKLDGFNTNGTSLRSRRFKYPAGPWIWYRTCFSRIDQHDPWSYPLPEIRVRRRERRAFGVAS